MKKILFSISLLITINMQGMINPPFFGPVAVQLIDFATGRASDFPARYYANFTDYVNGGVTFNYPVGLFSQIPGLRLSIGLKNAVYSTTETYVVIATANSNLATTVRVNKIINGGTVEEAATDDVTVFITATAPYTS